MIASQVGSLTIATKVPKNSAKNPRQRGLVTRILSAIFRSEKNLLIGVSEPDYALPSKEMTYGRNFCRIDDGLQPLGNKTYTMNSVLPVFIAGANCAFTGFVCNMQRHYSNL